MARVGPHCHRKKIHKGKFRPRTGHEGADKE